MFRNGTPSYYFLYLIKSILLLLQFQKQFGNNKQKNTYMISALHQKEKIGFPFLFFFILYISRQVFHQFISIINKKAVKQEKLVFSSKISHTSLWANTEKTLKKHTFLCVSSLNETCLAWSKLKPYNPRSRSLRMRVS